MAHRQGIPFWYELQSTDPDAAKAFYDAVIGWSVEAQPAGAMDYRMIGTADGSHVGGVMRLSGEMAAGGARPGWMFYVGVDDVDGSTEAIKAAGGAIVMGPWTMPGVGRMALATDPQGLPFYIMRGDGSDPSTAFDRTELGKGSWNELITPDQPAAHAFYAAVFGWTYPDKMAMPGDMGDYVFVTVGETQIGATMRDPGAGHSAAPAPGWRFYFRAPDVDAAASKVAEAGGTVTMGPHDVPGGDRIIVARDPHGTVFGVVGRAAGA